MEMLQTSSIFLFIAVIYAFFIVRNFYKNDKQWSLQAKIWSTIVAMFILVSLLV